MNFFYLYEGKPFKLVDVKEDKLIRTIIRKYKQNE